MNKIEFMRLWDIYKGLLTATQREITDLYFNLDLTVSEIAAEKNISRQGVSECLKTCKKQLEEFEQKLGFSRTLTEISLAESFMRTDAALWTQLLLSAHPELKDEAENLVSILDKDYSAEVRAALEKPETNDLLTADYSEEIKADILSGKIKIETLNKKG